MKSKGKIIALLLGISILISLALGIFYLVNADHPPDSVGALHNLQYGLTALIYFAVSGVLSLILAVWGLVRLTKKRKMQ